MALTINLYLYRALSTLGAPISSDGSYSNPITWAVGQNGGTIEQRMVVKSDESGTEFFPIVKIFARDSVSPDESGWFQFAMDENGGAGIYSDSIEFDVPLNDQRIIWIKGAIPEAVPRGTKSDIGIVVQYTVETVQ